MKPHKFSKVDLVFPTKVEGYIPEWEDLNREFQYGNHPACRLASRIFNGSPKIPANVEFHAIEGIEAEIAYHHIMYLLHSWEPKHEHKIGGVGYLISIWFKKIIVSNESGEEVLWEASE